MKNYIVRSTEKQGVCLAGVFPHATKKHIFRTMTADWTGMDKEERRLVAGCVVALGLVFSCVVAESVAESQREAERQAAGIDIAAMVNDEEERAAYVFRIPGAAHSLHMERVRLSMPGSSFRTRYEQ